MARWKPSSVDVYSDMAVELVLLLLRELETQDDDLINHLVGIKKGREGGLAAFNY